ncbi:MAG: hypothetical protein ACYDBJ_16500 [Aggregatilineales bacterium]
MADITFEEIVQAAQKLTPPQKSALIHTLQPDFEITSLTREQAIADLEALRAAGAFEHVDSLFGKFAAPNVTWDADELDTFLREVGTEWESEMDELADDDTTNPSAG